MAITKIQSNAFPATIDLSNVDLTLGDGEVVTANIADTNVTHAKLHTDMDLSSKTVTLPTLNTPLTVFGNGNATLQWGDDTAIAALSFDTNDNPLIRSYSGKDLFFQTNGGNNRMVIASDGNVGINNNNPLQKFSVNGRMNVDQDGDYYGAWIDGNTTGDSWFAVGTWYSNGGRMTAGTTEGQGLHLYTHNTSHQLTLQKDGGNVGIGTDSPNNALRVVASSSQATTDGAVVIKNEMNNGFEALKLETNNSRDSILSFRSTGTNSYWWGMGIDNSDSGKFKMGADNLLGVNNRLVITQAGNVGIGTASPTQKLHVDGDVLASRYHHITVQVGNVSSSSATMEWNRHYTFQIPANNTWYTVITNFRDTAGRMITTVSDSASGDVAEYVFRMTTPPYGVSMFSQLNYTNGGWNTGAFNFRTLSNGSAFDLQCQYSSYYSSSNTATGRIMFTNI